jgi:uncharacterized delta-60 repeat protein
MTIQGGGFSAVTVSGVATLVLAGACSTFASSGAEGEPSPSTSAEGGDEVSAVDVAGSPLVVSLQAGNRIELTRGSRTDVVVKIERRESFRGEAVITVGDLPQGVVAEPLTILAGETSGTLGLTSSPSVPHGVATPVLRAADRESKLPAAELRFDLVLRGTPGSLDESFGTKGVADVPLAGASFGAMASQADGKLVYAGNGGGLSNVAVGRLLPNGVPDLAFGSQGVRRFGFGTGSDNVVSVLTAPDGKITVVGNAANEQSVGFARLTPAGALDLSVNAGRTTTVGSGVVAQAARLADDGSVFVVARTSAFDVAVGKITPAGAIDAAFGTGGWVTIPTSAFASAVRLTASGIAVSPAKIIVSFLVVREGGLSRVGIATLATTGQGAPVLGETTGSEATQFQLPVVAKSDGRVVVGLNSRVGSGPEAMLLYGFYSDGKTMDSNFGGGNPVVSAADDVPFGMVEDGSKRLLVAGQVYSSPFKFRLLRFLPEGMPDASFATSGVSEKLVGDEGLAKAVVVQPDGRIALGGDRTSAAVSAPTILRYWP